jgi:alkylation response protein AidB-like acyl-CoA dehydrogenase
MEFLQDPPRLGNQYDDDRVLRSWLRRALPRDVLAEVEPGLRRLGARAAGDLLELADAAEASPPRHVPFDAWGRRVDLIETSDAWRALDRAAAEEGIVATAYERTHGAHARVHQLARLHLYHPSSAVYSCPLAMTDGAARVLELMGGDDPYLRGVFSRLTSRDPARCWTSGQWMTERSGGSDVSGTSTVARPCGDDAYALSGTKWFTSATTSQVALTLARIDEPGADLSLFLVELRDGAGALRNIEVLRLKDKLGTRALPTAELALRDTPARLIGGPGHGVRRIATVLNITRLYNAVCAVAAMRRAIALATDYATRRTAFGRPLADHPLHVETLAGLAVEYAGGLALAFHVGALLGREECGEATPEERLLLRLLTPVAKLYTGKQVVAVTSEAIEAFGGAGYIEDTGLPRLLRDAQVLSIWEGTTNVLSLDVLRATARDGTLDAFGAAVSRRLDALRDAAPREHAPRVAEALRRIVAHAARAAHDESSSREAAARSFAVALARTYTASLLLEHADWSAREEGADDARRAATVARRWCAQELAPLVVPDAAHRAASAALLAGEPSRSAPAARPA